MVNNMQEYDIIIIGAGPGGYETALYAKEKGLSVLLVEKDKIGGTCLNCGCIPTKTYNAIAKEIYNIKESDKIGINATYNFDFSKAKERKESVVNELSSGINFLLKKAGIDLINGQAKLKDKNTIIVNDEEYKSKYIIIATGSHNLNNIIKGSENALDSTSLLDINEVPKKLAIIGGGVIGVEMACIFNQFGSSVTIYEGLDSILANLDRELSRRITSYLTRQSISINTKAFVKEIKANSLIFEKNANTFEEEYDATLLSIGRCPNIDGLGLDEVGIEYNKKGIITDDTFKTNILNIYAIGDCNGKTMLAHFASYSGQVAIDNILGKDTLKYPCPSAIFSIPEIASVGYTEEELKNKGIEYKVNKVMYRSNGKALALNESEGFIKTLIVDDKLVGCHIIGYDASTLIHEAMLVMNTNINCSKVKKFIFAHPTLSELFKNSL